MSYRSLVGTWHYDAGASGTITLPNGAFIIQILFTGGTCSIFGGDVIPSPGTAPGHLEFPHDGARAKVGDPNTVVFVGTTSFFVEWVLS